MNEQQSWVTTASAIEQERLRDVFRQCMRLRPALRVHHWLDNVYGKFQIRQLAALLRVSETTVKRVCKQRHLYAVGMWHYNLRKDES